MNRPAWIDYSIGFAASAFGILCLCLLFVCFASYSAIRDTSAALQKTIEAYEPVGKNAGELTERVNRFLTSDELKNLKNNLDTSALTAQQTANAYSAVADETVRTMRSHVQPQIDLLGNEARLTIAEARATTAELRMQIKQNGDSAKKVIDKGYDFMADSEKEVLDTLKALKISGQNLTVLTDDQHLQKTIEELNATAKNATATTGNVASITADIAGVSDKYLSPLYKAQPPKSFFGKVGAGIKYGIRLLSGTGNLIVLVDKLQ